MQSFFKQTPFDFNVPPQFQAQEPSIFDDDEPVVQKLEETLSGNPDSNDRIKFKTHLEGPAVAKSEAFNNFGIVVNLKAPATKGSLNSRTPIDLVTILDISGSMTGTKIALLKQAMGFVVQNLGPLDRLSVISFSSSAHRLFPLRHMTEIGKQESIQMINSLVASGGTRIADALKKGSKVMSDRKFKNPVSSMILLSDGQDNYTKRNPQNGGYTYDPEISVFCDTRIPIHTFGFGRDHDPTLMHSIAEQSGGMFSFIEVENVIQDAFAQCIGGLLSVVVQELRVEVECVHPVLRLGSIKAGSYKVGMDGNGRWGFIEVGDLYAEEERDFLISMDIPVNESGNEMSLVKFRVIHKDPIKNTFINIQGNEVRISRPETVGNQTVSLEVDRQRNRLKVASAIADARVAAEQGNHTEATRYLSACKKALGESASARGGDVFGAQLADDLGVMLKGMANSTAYESTGRANMLAQWGAHSKQRVTTNSAMFGGSMQAYQTPAQYGMVAASQAAPPKDGNPEGRQWNTFANSAMFGAPRQAYQTPAPFGMFTASQAAPPKDSNREGQWTPSQTANLTMFGGPMQANQTPAPFGMFTASQAAPPKDSNREGQWTPSQTANSFMFGAPMQANQTPAPFGMFTASQAAPPKDSNREGQWNPLQTANSSMFGGPMFGMVKGSQAAPPNDSNREGQWTPSQTANSSVFGGPMFGTVNGSQAAPPKDSNREGQWTPLQTANSSVFGGPMFGTVNGSQAAPPKDSNREGQWTPFQPSN